MNLKSYLPSSITSRLYDRDHDLHSMMDMLMEARARTYDWHYAHVGELLFNFFMVACHLNPREHIRLWHDQNGKLVAYAILGEDPSFDFQVMPEYEWTGIEAEAFAWVEMCLTRLRQHDAKLWGGQLVSGSRQDDARRISFLEQHGFHYCGKFAEVNMLRSLSEPIPELVIPPGHRVCSMAELSDIPVGDRAAAHREVWQPWTVGNVSDDDYASFMQLPGYNRDLDVVTLTPDGVIASFVNGWTDPVNRIGDFGPVGARQEYRQQGLTRLAMIESLRRMKAYGMERVCISTGISNTPARNLYTSMGFKVENQYLDYVKTG
jgi:GNAT superfamily N-acetyltransferase